MSEERTEAPTQRRLRELSSQGTTARSQDLSSALVLLAAVLGLRVVAPLVVPQATGALQQSLLDVGRGEITYSDLFSFVWPLLSTGALLVGGVVLPAATVALVSGLFQTKGHIGFGLLRPNPGRLNPLASLRQLASFQSIANLFWPVLKVVVLGLAVGGPIRGLLDQLPTAVGLGVGYQLQFLGDSVLGIIQSATFALVGLAVGDVIYRRWQFLRQARMSRKDIREELKQTEGDPSLRARIRALQRRIARGRMLHRVPQATVVVANPTHYAVALVYQPGDMVAPEVVAKGVDLIALRIIDIARENRVPVVVNPPVARALYKSVEVGQAVPSAYYRAIAEILAHVYSLRRRR